MLAALVVRLSLKIKTAFRRVCVCRAMNRTGSQTSKNHRFAFRQQEERISYDEASFWFSEHLAMQLNRVHSVKLMLSHFPPFFFSRSTFGCGMKCNGKSRWRCKPNDVEFPSTSIGTVSQSHLLSDGAKTHAERDERERKMHVLLKLAWFDVTVCCLLSALAHTVCWLRDFNHSAAKLPWDLTNQESFCGLMDRITHCSVPGTGYDKSNREVNVKHFQKSGEKEEHSRRDPCQNLQLVMCCFLNWFSNWGEDKNAVMNISCDRASPTLCSAKSKTDDVKLTNDKPQRA